MQKKWNIKNQVLLIFFARYKFFYRIDLLLYFKEGTVIFLKISLFVNMDRKKLHF
jgi:hypothetical protein